MLDGTKGEVEKQHLRWLILMSVSTLIKVFTWVLVVPSTIELINNQIHSLVLAPGDCLVRID